MDNLYDDLRTIEPAPAGFLPLRWGNRMEGYTYGLEAWGAYQVAGLVADVGGFQPAVRASEIQTGRQQAARPATDRERSQAPGLAYGPR